MNYLDFKCRWIELQAFFILKDALPSIASCDDVTQSLRQIDLRFPGHCNSTPKHILQYRAIVACPQSDFLDAPCLQRRVLPVST